MAQALQEHAYETKVPSSTPLLQLSPEWPGVKKRLGLQNFPCWGEVNASMGLT